MAGALNARRMNQIEANWESQKCTTGFTVQIVTDGERHESAIDAAIFTALNMMMHNTTVYLRDSEEETVIVWNRIGHQIQQDWANGDLCNAD